MTVGDVEISHPNVDGLTRNQRSSGGPPVSPAHLGRPSGHRPRGHVSLHLPPRRLALAALLDEKLPGVWQFQRGKSLTMKDYAARLKSSKPRIQLDIGFHLGQIWATIPSPAGRISRK